MTAEKVALERSYAGRTPSQRAADRRAALLDAALEAIAADGWRQLSVELLCRTARLNKRYFYESFTGIDDVSAALVDHLVGELLAVAATVDQDQPLPDVVRTTLDRFVRWLTDDPRRARVLFGEMGASRVLAAHRTAAQRQLAAGIAAHARSVHPEAPQEDPVSELVASALVGGLGQVVLDWLDEQIPMDREQLIEDLTALWLVTGDGMAEHAAGRAAPAQRVRRRRSPRAR